MLYRISKNRTNTFISTAHAIHACKNEPNHMNDKKKKIAISIIDKLFEGYSVYKIHGNYKPIPNISLKTPHR
jgi:hypothetical protein